MNVNTEMNTTTTAPSSSFWKEPISLDRKITNDEERIVKSIKERIMARVASGRENNGKNILFFIQVGPTCSSLAAEGLNPCGTGICVDTCEGNECICPNGVVQSTLCQADANGKICSALPLILSLL